ncbi:MAG TPA: DUF2062 domain-containing protein [Anaerohalosphaeraceae bacterium]|nr:DUF2062 domain-containing protein [Anaerohalosphaeraceae bacterium]
MWLNAWRKRQISVRRSLKNTYLHKIWGRQLFHSMLWKIDRRSIAGGLALGLFIAFTPSIPFQMLLATCGAIYFRVNLPIALACCWITNPLTALPVYTAAWKLGKYIIGDIEFIQSFLEFYDFKDKTAQLILQGLYLWTGSLLFSFVSAVSAVAAVHLLWKIPLPLKSRMALKKTRRKRIQNNEEGVPDSTTSSSDLPENP